MRGGDDLDDDFVAEGFEADVFSDDEFGVTAGEELSDADGSDEWLGIQVQSAAPTPSKKRKRKQAKEKKSKACALSHSRFLPLILQLHRNANWQKRQRARMCPW